MLRPLNIAVVVLFVCSLPITAQSADVAIPDKNLEKLIREILKKKQIEKEKITDEDLAKIFFLNGNGRGIENLSGLEHCRNLADVKLAKNKIKDPKPLASCKNIQTLNLANNQIESIDSLASLVKLQYLKLDNNKIKKIDAVAKFKNLMCLLLDGNQVESVAPVAGLPKLHALSLKKNKVKDLKPLSKVKWLSSLDLAENQVQDVKPLATLTELRWTFLQKNKIKDVGPLAAMAKKDAEGDKRFAPFWNLYLGGNPLNDASKKQHLAELKKHGVRLKMD